LRVQQIEFALADGKLVRIDERAYDPFKVTHFNFMKWSEVHTRERVRGIAQPS
jgi:hypothetical protein